ncbi:MAG UNVERIFIED_CONTAM: hypothetical protein LVT10_13775 [Anaerolineae bacterium]
MIDKLDQAFNRIFASAEARDKLGPMGFDLAPPGTPAAFARLIASDLAAWVPVVEGLRREGRLSRSCRLRPARPVRPVHRRALPARAYSPSASATSPRNSLCRRSRTGARVRLRMRLSSSYRVGLQVVELVESRHCGRG